MTFEDIVPGAKRWQKNCFIFLSLSALHYVTDRAPGSLWNEWRRHQHHLVQELHREAAADLPHGSPDPYVCWSILRFVGHLTALINWLQSCHPQHHVIIQQYMGTLENLLFTAELDHHILTVYQQFCALQLWDPTVHHSDYHTCLFMWHFKV